MKIPGYTILREIGKGNMATVYLATQESLGRQVALKVMDAALSDDPSFRKRFLQEGQIIAQVSHPNIVTIYDIGSHDRNYYIALEYAGGGNLRNWVGKLGCDESVELVKKVAGALGYAHKRGFVHRDVKPGNVLFRDDGSVLLSDFGIAKALDNASSQLTKVGMSVGTPKYMSPEQATGRPVTPQSDLYSLGVMFYELLSGKPPFEAESPLAVALMHVNTAPPEMPPHCAPLQPVVSRLLEKEPQRRFRDAAELIKAIEQAQAAAQAPMSVLDIPLSGDARTIPASAGRPAPQRRDSIRPAGGGAAVLNLEDTIPEPPSLLLRIATAPRRMLGTAARAVSAWAASIQSRLAVTARWALGLVAVAAFAGIGLYVFESLTGSGHVDLSQRTIHPESATDYLRAKGDYLKAVVKAYSAIKASDPDNASIEGMSREIAGQYEKMARESWAQGDARLSLSLIDTGLAVAPGYAGLEDLKQEITAGSAQEAPTPQQRQEIARLLHQATASIAASRFTLPAGNNAVESYQRVLQIDPRNKAALKGLNDLAALFERLGKTELYMGHPDQARLRVEQGLMISPTNKGILSLRDVLVKLSDDADTQ
jgi:tetratricopeptide (TPR) repeat protein